jgi:hypothetical protein
MAPQPLIRTPGARLVLLVIAIVLFVIYCLIGFGVVTSAHPDGFLGAGLAAFAAAFL